MSDGSIHRVFLIRHGETVDNVAGLYAGIRDSALTSHGALQTEKLGRYMASQRVVFTHYFCSDLSRAVKTAEAIQAPQPDPSLPIVQLLELREQDFGTGEGQPFMGRDAKTGINAKNTKATHRSQFENMETRASMTLRANRFLDSMLMPLMSSMDDEVQQVIAIVSHGMLLSSLWKAILARQQPNSVTVANELQEVHGVTSLEHLGGWSNTGYLELEFRSRPLSANERGSAALTSNDSSAFNIMIKVINGKDHLKDLKRTRGGVGSSKHDESQTSLHSFFGKKQKTSAPPATVSSFSSASFTPPL